MHILQDSRGGPGPFLDNVELVQRGDELSYRQPLIPVLFDTPLIERRSQLLFESIFPNRGKGPFHPEKNSGLVSWTDSLSGDLLREARLPMASHRNETEGITFGERSLK